MLIFKMCNFRMLILKMRNIKNVYASVYPKKMSNIKNGRLKMCG